MFGSHLSIAGSMVNALDEATNLSLDTVQVFTKNQQQWKAKPLDPAMTQDWLSRVKTLGWESRIVSHASYLINLASASEELWNKSIDLMTDEVERCQALGIPYLVHHPGSFVGWTLDEGIARIARAYAIILARTAGSKVILCLEGVSGAGSHIGAPFEHLATLRQQILSAAPTPARIGYCLDTCHLHAAGHDLSTLASASEAIQRFDALCGIANVRVLHMNDSKGTLASKLDRHDHIGHGWVGGGAIKHAGEGIFNAKALKLSGFGAFVNHPHFATIPKIVETPKGLDPQGVPWDTINIARLRSLMLPASLVPSNKVTSRKASAPTPAPPTTPSFPARRSQKSASQATASNAAAARSPPRPPAKKGPTSKATKAVRPRPSG